MRGGVILSLYGALLVAHFLAVIAGRDDWPRALAWIGVPLAVLSAVYTAWLFAQAKARDLWQSPLLPPQLLVQAAASGAAALLPIAAWSEPLAAPALVALAAAATLVHLLLVAGEVTIGHATAHARLAAREMTRGRYGRFFRAGRRAAGGRDRRGAPGRGERRSSARRSSSACSPTSTPSCRPARPCRSRRKKDMSDPKSDRVSASRGATLSRGETFYPGPSRSPLAAYPPRERWDDWVELDSRAWPHRVERHYLLVPTTCFNCESACGLLAYVDRETLEVRKFEGNPEHPGSRGRNCAKGPATLNQVHDPDRILYPLKRAGKRGENRWQRVSLGRGAHGHRRADPQGDRRGAPERRHVPRRPPRRGRLHRARARGVGRRRPQLAHQHLLLGGRAGYQLWMGFDRPSPDHANAEVILLISAHLESGHYFNPHAQRIMDGKARGAKLIVIDMRLSNTATHADHWLAPWPGSEAAILLAIASWLIREKRYDREFVRRWWNWQEYLAAERPGEPASFEAFEQGARDALRRVHASSSPRASPGSSAAVIEEVARLVAEAGPRLTTHNWRSAAAGNLGGWQVARCLFLLNALLGAVACRAASSRTPGTSSCRSRSTRRRTRRSGTS